MHEVKKDSKKKPFYLQNFTIVQLGNKKRSFWFF